MNIKGFIKTSLLDYPGKIAATIFMGGCNFRCPFCHNLPLVLRPEKEGPQSFEYIMKYLDKRKNVLEGVCISGGEPTLSPELPVLCEQIKGLGYEIKLDTNGSRPDVLKKLHEKHLIDYVAMDIKAAPKNYLKAAGVESPDMQKIDETIGFLISGKSEYEFRTTVVKGLHTEEDFKEIAEWIKGARIYYLQAYRKSENVENSEYSTFSKNEMEQFLKLVEPNVPAYLRGI